MTTNASTWFEARRPTLTYIGISTLTWPLLLGAVYFALPAAAPLEAPVERLLLAVQWGVAPALVLLVMIMGCMRILDNDRSEDPFAGAESRRFQINQRVIQNTLEQLGYFLPALLALAVRIDASHTRFIPVLALTWSIGRVVFWIGYQVEPHHRSLGFSWTQNTAMLTVIWFLVTLG